MRLVQPLLSIGGNYGFQTAAKTGASGGGEAMSQQPIPYEQAPAYLAQSQMVQAMWVQTAISVLMALGMIAYFIAEVLKVGSEVFKEALKR